MMLQDNQLRVTVGQQNSIPSVVKVTLYLYCSWEVNILYFETMNAAYV